jgi:hypothetical protein
MFEPEILCQELWDIRQNMFENIFDESMTSQANDEEQNIHELKYEQNINGFNDDEEQNIHEFNDDDIYDTQDRLEDIDKNKIVNSTHISPLLCGNTLGAQANRIFTNYSISILILTGNYKRNGNMSDIGSDSYACYIATNQIHKKYTLDQKYKLNYENWINVAISDLIEKLLSIPDPCILFPNTNTQDELFFDVLLNAKSINKWTRVFLYNLSKNDTIQDFELCLDTVFFDNRIW